VALELRRIRGSRLAWILLGVILVYEGYGYQGTARILTARFQIGETVLGAGAFLIGYGLATLYRRKGDYDDVDEPAAKDDDTWTDFDQAASRLEHKGTRKKG
jgi:hypothetical protein